MHLSLEHLRQASLSHLVRLSGFLGSQWAPFLVKLQPPVASFHAALDFREMPWAHLGPT